MASEPRGGCPVQENFDPLCEAFLTDPFAVLATLPLDEAGGRNRTPSEVGDAETLSDLRSPGVRISSLDAPGQCP